MRLIALSLLLALTCSAFGTEPPEVDSAEVMRRGDMVVVAGEGPRSAAETAYLLAMAPPPDDSHKWYVTVFTTPDCVPCAKLKEDFRKAPELLAFVTAPEESKAWAHYNEFSVSDATQKWRTERYRLTSYPAIVIQPPRNGMWGDPRTVVMQKVGYDGDAKKLAQKIRETVKAYSTKMAEKGYPREPVEEEEVSLFHESDFGGATQAAEPIGTDPPFSVPARPDPFNPQPQYQPPVQQWPPPAQPQPAVQPTDQGGGFMTKLTAIFGVLGVWLLVALRVLERIAPLTPTNKDDLALAAVRQVVDYLARLGVIRPDQTIPPASGRP